MICKKVNDIRQETMQMPTVMISVFIFLCLHTRAVYYDTEFSTIIGIMNNHNKSLKQTILFVAFFRVIIHKQRHNTDKTCNKLCINVNNNRVVLSRTTK